LLPSGWPTAELGLVLALPDGSLPEVLPVTDPSAQEPEQGSRKGGKDLSVMEKPALGQRQEF